MHQQASSSDQAAVSSLQGNGSFGRIAASGNSFVLEDLYEQWKVNPESVDVTWRSFFEGFSLGCQTQPSRKNKVGSESGASSANRIKQARIYNVLFAYRTLGHYVANLDPLGFNKTEIPELDLHHFKLDEKDLDSFFDSGTLAGGGEKTLRDILGILKETYCGTIGIEYMHIQNFTVRRWLRDRLESMRNRRSFPIEKKKRVLNRLLQAEQFEQFLHTRHVGQKRFSLEGCETLIPVLDAVIEASPKNGIEHIVMGMAHRGRLNVLANILGKDYKFLFNEFEENYIPETVLGDGDVKYHLGYQGTINTSEGQKVGISLAPNPSHLEAVDPVVQGKARAWQRKLNDTTERRKVLPILIHGDAAFVGQGVVWETLNLSQLHGYKTGGTVHIVINNQIGFTTIPEDARSTHYCTAVAKSLDIPVFHVNGDDPLSAVFVIELAMEFRQRFRKDIVIDLVCYRRHGHNEGDEPSFTQPVLYNAIQSHPLISDILLKEMTAQGDINQAEATAFKKEFEERLNQALAESKADVKKIKPKLRTSALSCPELLQPVDTAVTPENFQRVGMAITQEPTQIKLNVKIKRLLENRRAMVEGKQPLDWAFAETMAFGTLLDQAIPVRLSGQDSRRGTFSQRHSVLYDVDTRERYIPLRNISEKQAAFCVYNSPLSEYAVLGFDYGYSLDYPDMLCLWEAQFGDFANGAQLIIDQYLVSSQSKWGISSGMVLLLPHGYDGQGPEHSSARLERFLQACAEDNIIVANCSTPANHFHALRRQALRTVKRPLIAMTPKGLLRDPRCASPLNEFISGRFQEIIPDAAKTSGAKRLIFCAGKVYYDLAKYRDASGLTDTAIVRIEQLYPLHTEKLKEVLKAHSKAEKIIWCQEESANMGAWSYIEPHLRHVTGRDIIYAGRDASSSPATGSLGMHKIEQQDLVEQAFRA